MGDVERITVEGRKGRDEGGVAEDLGDDGVPVRIDDHGAREDPTVGERLELRTPQGRGPEVVVEMAVVVWFNVRYDLGGDAAVGEIVLEGFQESVDLVHVCARHGPVCRECGVADRVGEGVTCIKKGGE